MSGTIKTIKAKDDNNIEHNIFPKTVLEAVVKPETNETLDNILDELDNKKVNTSDIVDNLVSTATDVPLSANQGNVLNALISNTVSKLRTGEVLTPRYGAKYMTFTNGVARFDLSAYTEGGIFDPFALATFQTSSFAVVTAARMEGNVMVVQAYHILDAKVYSGEMMVQFMYFIIK